MSDADFEREIERRLNTALRQLSVLDNHLLANDVNERSITHRLAVYLQQHFDGWDVDIEYDGFEQEPHHLGDLERQLTELGTAALVRDTDCRTVYPDIVVHHRATGDHLLVLEVKKSTSRVPDALDRAKLEGYKCDPKQGYRHACLVRLRVGEGDKERYAVEFV